MGELASEPRLEGSEAGADRLARTHVRAGCGVGLEWRVRTEPASATCCPSRGKDTLDT